MSLDRCRGAEAERSDCRRTGAVRPRSDQPDSRLHGAIRRRPRPPRGVRTGRGNRNGAVRSRSRRAVAGLAHRGRRGAARSTHHARSSPRECAIGALPPGPYQLRAIVAVGDAIVKTMSRAFEIAGPAALSATSDDVPGGRRPGERHRAVPASRVERSRRAISAGRRAPARDPRAVCLASSSRRESQTSTTGLAALRNRDYIAAEGAFKRAIRPNQDFTAAVAYLAVSFAASGHDVEAASAWQTALVGGSEVPQIYLWLGNALLRTHDFSRARSTLEDAARRWPADTRFARPLAVLNATTGRGYEAIQFAAAIPGRQSRRCRCACFSACRWIYQIHLNGGLIRDRAADLRLAQTYADEYKQANGAEAAPRDASGSTTSRNPHDSRRRRHRRFDFLAATFFRAALAFFLRSPFRLGSGALRIGLCGRARRTIRTLPEASR